MHLPINATNRESDDGVPMLEVKILTFLNMAKTAEEIVGAVMMLSGKKDISVRVARKILERQAQLGGFTDIKQVRAVRGVGCKRFASIAYVADKMADYTRLSSRVNNARNGAISTAER